MKDKERALRWAKALVVFQEVGSGPDRNLGKMHHIVALMKEACKDETGIELDSYPYLYVKLNDK